MKAWHLVLILNTVLLLSFTGGIRADDAWVLEIRQEYKSIREASPSLARTEIEVSDYSTEGGKATSYSDKQGTIRLIKVELDGESGKVLEEFYYRKGALIFVFRENHRYNVPYYVTAESGGGVAFDPKKTKITEDRFYFVKGRMLRWIDENGAEVKAGAKAFKDSERDITRFSRELLARFRANP